MTSGVCSRDSRAITVLFVDDDADVLFAYQLITTEGGMLVELARDGHAALALAGVVLPDVIVLDSGFAATTASTAWKSPAGFARARVQARSRSS